MEIQPFSFQLHGSNQWPGLGKWPKLPSITANLADVKFKHTQRYCWDSQIASCMDTGVGAEI